MFDPQLVPIIGLAAALGLGHTLAGPDHYVPFIAMSRARGWGMLRTGAITGLCGVGHVASSVVIGAIGITIGISIGALESLEGGRGNIAAWLLLFFGLAYAIWGIHRSRRNHCHSHIGHDHKDDPEQQEGQQRADTTPWILFTIFLFGPCEPLIPLLMAPAAKLSVMGVVYVVAAFSIATIGTMLVMVMAGTFGLGWLPNLGLQRYAHALAGTGLAVCGALMLIGL